MTTWISLVTALLLQAAPQSSSQPAAVGSMYDGNNAQLTLPQEPARSAAPHGQRNAPGAGGPAAEQNPGTSGGTVGQGRESVTTTTSNPKSPPASGGGR